ncbi:MAG: restriction endonuclease subunit S [Firmicutes bacterium]|nr:restriction endonuclease subunit S [Bacillota bacterium]
MTASLNEKLRTVKWGKYKLGSLFEIDNTLSFNADVLVPGEKYDYVTRTSLNQGILQSTGFVNKENINPAGTWSLGLLQMDFFYRRKPWYAGQFMRKITPKITIPKGAILFVSTVLNMQKPILLSVLVRNVDSTFKNIEVYLPVSSEGNIDFNFMESFVAELEAERIAELEAERIAEQSAYLTVSGLDNYELSKEEERAITDYSSYVWKSFNLKDLYGKSTRGKRLKSEDRIPGTLPFVTAGEAEEGVSAFIGNDVEVFEKNTTTIDMFGSAKYRNYRYGGDDHVAIVHTENVPMKASIFVTSACHKAAHTGKFDYGHNFYAKDADALDIMLPSKDGKPDYQAMALLISAIQKLVIKDVVRYADRKVAGTKYVIGK